MKEKGGFVTLLSYIHGIIIRVMRVLRVIDDMVEIFWVDDNEIEFVCIDEFITKYGIEKIQKFF